ncbi:hypothetical protein CAL12_15015 [Bordetella genomosp. 8]|uniref:Autotransporter domain-containing protein n=1 Tax=Bordetella genomosp. 8 TaxID=1416806 RepID=A0A1W6YLY0_9BORD|nr:autotransporter domain-containing protein [Bordetella genomosp. 8]ARP81994.1 hypothetical protein CAL12_15015 [Bordetella genomosp. 8]
MNRVYRRVRNAKSGAVQVASEGARSVSTFTGGGRALKPMAAVLMALGMTAIAAPCVAQSAAQGGSVGSDRSGMGGAGNGEGGGARLLSGSSSPTPIAGTPASNGVGGAGASGTDTGSGVAGAGGGGGGLATGPSPLLVGGQGTDGASDSRLPGGGGGGGAAVFDNSAISIDVPAGFQLVGGAGGAGGPPTVGSGAGGAGGGGGGAGVIAGDPNVTVQVLSGGSVTGGAGGAGGSGEPAFQSFGGGGGGGGDGLVLTNIASRTINHGVITGGAGGAGGSAFSTGGGGGEGGDGIRILGTDSSVQNDGVITGGRGGAGGTAAGGNGDDGVGGAGVRAIAPRLLVTNSGAIRGGDGTGNGAAGAAIVVQGTSGIDNAGELSGGVTTGGGRAPAVIFNGTNNQLFLEVGSLVRGALQVNSGAVAQVTAETNVALDGALLNGGSLTLLLPTGNTLDLGNTILGAGTVNASGAGTVALKGANISGTIDFANSGGVGLAGNIQTTGSQHYASAVALDAATTLFSTAGSLTLDGGIDGARSLNLFASGTVTVGGAIGGTVPLTALTVNAQALAASGSIDAGALSITTSDDLTQQGAYTVTGNASFSATGGDITLTNAGNHFGSASLIAAGDATLVASGPLTISLASVGQNLSVSTTGGTLTLPAGATTGAGFIHLSGDQIQTGPLTANEVELSPSSGMSLSGDVTSSTALVLQSPGAGAITQTAGRIFASTLQADLGGGLTLTSAGNIISNIGDITAQDVAIASTAPLTVNGTVNARSLVLAGAQGVTITGNVTADTAQIGAGTTWTVGAGATTGSLVADTAVDGTLRFDRSDNVSFANVLTGNATGQLIQSGAGKLVFDGDGSAFDGNTTVQAGGLVVGSTAGSGAVLGGSVTVGSGASLGGHGRIAGNAALAGGAVLSPGNSIGTLTVDGNFSMASGSIMDAELGAAGNGDKVAVGGDLALNGVTLNISDAGGMGPGVYNIFSYGGSLTETNGGIFFGSQPAGHTLQLQTLTGDKRINIVDATNTTLQYWNANHLADPTRMGGGSGTWSVTSPVWTDANGSVTGAMTPQPGFAVFGGAAGVVTVDGTAGAVVASGMQFLSDGYRVDGAPVTLVGAAGTPVIRVGNGNATGAGYVATIDSVLAGVQGLNKMDAGTLVLNGLNTYSGGTTISGGAIAVSDDRNLGDASNGVSLQGGNLRITGTAYTATSRALTLLPGGAVDVADAGNVFSWNGAISGTGALVKQGAGTLVLNGTTTYTGGTTVAAGTLQGNTATLKGDIVNHAALVFAQDTDGSYTGTMSGTGSMTKLGAGALTLTGANSYTGGTTVSAGTLVGSGTSLQGNIVNNATVIFNQPADGSYGGVLSGNGSLLKQGAGTLAVNGDSGAYAGSTQLLAGGLEVNGRLGGTLTVDNGTTLSGTGTVGTTSIASGATLSPGNADAPVATLTVNGNLSFAPGSTYRADTTVAGAHDSVHVTGTAHLAGSVVDVGENGTYTASTTYRLLTADGGVNGQFDSVSSNLAFLTPSLNYDANNVDLLMQLKQDGTGASIDFADAARTRNQRATANGLQSLPATSALYTRVLNLPEGAPPAVFDSLSGEIHASTTSVLLGVADNVATLPLAHLRANLDAGQAAGAPTAQLGAGDASAMPRAAAQPVWAQVFGNWRTLDGDGNAAKVKDTDSGLFVGADRGVGNGWRVGGALGYTDSDIDVHQRGSTSDVDSYSATVYGGKAFDAGAGKINLSVGAGYTWHDIRSKRDVNAAGADQELKADYRASTAQVFTELGYAMPLNERVTLEPFIGGSYSDLRTRGFAESGGDAALSGDSASNKVAATTLGLHARMTFDSAGAQGSLHGTLGWRHAYGDVTPDTTMAFDGGQPFTVAGTPIARDAALLQLGVEMAVSRSTTVGVAYGGQFGDGNKQNTGTLDVRYRF